MIRFIVDSGMDRNEWLETNYDFGFLPLTVIMDGKEYLDDEEVKLLEVYKYMEDGNFPKTSQLTPYRAKETFEKYAKNGDDVIYIAVHKELSGTYQSGYTALQEVKEAYPDFKAEIVNSNGAAGGSALHLIQAAEMSKVGYSFEEIVEQLKWYSHHTNYHFFVDSLSWIAKGGRIPKSIGAMGSALKIKAYLGLDEEGVVKRGIIRGKERAFRKIIRDIVEGMEGFKDQIISISYVGAYESIEPLVEAFKEKIPQASIQLFKLGPVLASHVGIGGFSIMYIDEATDKYIIPRSIK